MNSFRISVSIVTYNNEKEISTVLKSLFESSIIEKIDIFVIDNCSTDNTIEIIKNSYKSINIISMKKNVGYGSGHNAAIKLVSSKYHFVINPDIIFDSKLLENIVDYFENDNSLALAIPNVYDINNKLKYPPKKDPKIRYLIGRYFASKGKIFKKWADEYECKNIDHDKPIEIEFCSGSFMSFRTSVLKLVGGFDSRFFLYFEDADLSRRIREQGKVLCIPYFKVQHEGKRASHKSIKGLKMMLTSMFKYFHKWGWRF